MTDVILEKRSPLAAVYRARGAHVVEAGGWRIAEHFGNLEAEKDALKTGSVLADWSHIGKITLRGEGAEAEAARIDPRAQPLKPLEACGEEARAVLRLTDDEFLILCQPGAETAILKMLSSSKISVVNQTGGRGCFALGGAERDKVIERSAAMNLRRDHVRPGAVIETTVHAVSCTIYRTAALDILIHGRDLSEFLFDALMDVGAGVGLVPGGIGAIPVAFAPGD